MVMFALVDIPPGLGYLALFLLVAGESAGLPIPGETSLSTAAVLASRGKLDIELVVLVAATAAVLGDNCGYAVGRLAGRPLLEREGLGMRRRRMLLEQTDRFYAHRGALTVFVGRWLPVLRFTAALFAGVNHMPWRKFFVYNLAGGVCWSVSVGVLAYQLGTRAGNTIEAVGAIGLVVVVLALAGHFVWRRVTRPGTGI